MNFRRENYNNNYNGRQLIKTISNENLMDIKVEASEMSDLNLIKNLYLIA